MGYFCKERTRRAALIALLGMFFQAIIPLAQAVPLDRNDDDLFDRLVICTYYGFKVINIATGAEIPQGDDESDGPVTGNPCLVCLAYAIGKIALGGVWAVENAPPFTPSIRIPSLNQLQPQHLANAGGRGARAPPSAS